MCNSFYAQHGVDIWHVYIVTIVTNGSSISVRGMSNSFRAQHGVDIWHIYIYIYIYSILVARKCMVHINRLKD
jgi:NADPH-dependent 7-cyano-7-deazaguanine reductase QueF-like protein